MSETTSTFNVTLSPALQGWADKEQLIARGDRAALDALAGHVGAELPRDFSVHILHPTQDRLEFSRLGELAADQWQALQGLELEVTELNEQQLLLELAKELATSCRFNPEAARKFQRTKRTILGGTVVALAAAGAGVIESKAGKGRFTPYSKHAALLGAGIVIGAAVRAGYRSMRPIRQQELNFFDSPIRIEEML